MPGIRLRRGKIRVHPEAAAPVLQPRLLRGDEILVGDRLDAAGPKPAGAAEIGNSGFGRDAGAGQRDDPLRPRDQAAQRRNFLVAFSVPHLIFPGRNEGARNAIFAHHGPRHRCRPVPRFLRQQARHAGSPPAHQRRRPLHADFPRRARGREGPRSREAPLLELTYNWDPEKYGEGRNFGHLAFEVDNIYDLCDKLQKAGVTINRPPRDGNMAFIRSPDNISIEILQKGAALPAAEPWKSMQNTGKW